MLLCRVLPPRTVFLQTGLRIGGLARLQLPSSSVASLDTTSSTYLTTRLFCVIRVVTSHKHLLTTIEKNGKLRRVLLPVACTRLLADWLVVRGRGTPGPWVFPSSKDPTTSVHRNWIWTVCRRIFRRADVNGPHVHPHTFRHTVIRLLYMNGVTMERIAKWIGHSSAAITSDTYNRLQNQACA